MCNNKGTIVIYMSQIPVWIGDTAPRTHDLDTRRSEWLVSPSSSLYP